MMSKSDIKIFDEYHSVCRDATISLKACNEKFETHFELNNNSKAAWDEYCTDYEDLKLAENVIDGEWLTSKMPSMSTYLKKHNALQSKKRQFVIDTYSGVNEVKELNTEKVTIPMEELEVEAKELKMEKINLEDAFVTPAEEVQNEIMKLKNPSYGSTFEAALEAYRKEDNTIDWEDAVVFLPSQEAVAEKEITKDFIRNHVFPDKQGIVESLNLWKKTLHVKNSLYDANDLFVLNVDTKKVKIHKIPYVFKDLEKKGASADALKVRLVGNRHL